MNYSLRDYQGNEITISTEQAIKIADIAELIEVRVGSQTHYINPKNVASIKPAQGKQDIVAPSHQIERPDHRGQDSPAKEALRKKFQQ